MLLQKILQIILTVALKKSTPVQAVHANEMWNSVRLEHCSSRSNIEMFYDTGRLSRVDSYVRGLDRRIEHEFPSTYAKYRSSSRPYLPQEYTPVSGYTVRCYLLYSFCGH